MSRLIAMLVAAVFAAATLPAGAQAPAPADKGAALKMDKKAKKDAAKARKAPRKYSPDKAERDARKAKKDAPK